MCFFFLCPPTTSTRGIDVSSTDRVDAYRRAAVFAVRVRGLSLKGQPLLIRISMLPRPTIKSSREAMVSSFLQLRDKERGGED